MAKYDENSVNRLPLLEAVIVIAIFALISVAIMRLYVSADNLQGRSVNISKATILAENRIEALASGAEDTTAGTVWFDKSWEDCSETEAYFCMTTAVRNSEKGVTGELDDITVTVAAVGGETLVSFDTSVFIPVR